MFRIRERYLIPAPVLVTPVRPIPMRPPADAETILQPLREIGTMEKTQPWSTEDIQAALRFAHLRGIEPERLYGTAKRLES